MSVQVDSRDFRTTVSQRSKKKKIKCRRNGTVFGKLTVTLPFFTAPFQNFGGLLSRADGNPSFWTTYWSQLDLLICADLVKAVLRPRLTTGPSFFTLPVYTLTHCF